MTTSKNRRTQKEREKNIKTIFKWFQRKKTIHSEYEAVKQKEFRNISETSFKRDLNALESAGYLKSKRGPRNAKSYSLTFLGVVQIFLNWNNKKIETNEIIQIVDNYPDVGLLSFKKFPVFKKAGLESLAANYVAKGFFRAFRKWLTIQEYLKSGLVEENFETVIDRSIITDSIIIDKNKEFTEVCKNDSELKHFIEVDFKRRRMEFNAYEDAKNSWETI